MPKSRPSAPRPSGNGPARNNSRPAGRAPRPGSGQNSAVKPTKPVSASKASGSGSKNKTQPKQKSDSHVSSYSVGSPLNRQMGVLQSTGARLIGLGLIVGLCVLMVLPVARNYFNQRSEISELNKDLISREQLNEDLENQLNRWQDDSYVIAQARERFTFVFPGENPYRVMDSDKFVPPEDENSGPQIKPDVQEPWFNTLWSSVEQAGNVGTEESLTKNPPEAESDTEGAQDNEDPQPDQDD